MAEVRILDRWPRFLHTSRVFTMSRSSAVPNSEWGHNLDAFNLERARQGVGPTVFDWLVEIINDHRTAEKC